MLGLFNIFHGDADGTPGSHEHMNDITLGYSRDGFHWYRPDRTEDNVTPSFPE